MVEGVRFIGFLDRCFKSLKLRVFLSVSKDSLRILVFQVRGSSTVCLKSLGFGGGGGLVEP